MFHLIAKQLQGAKRLVRASSFKKNGFSLAEMIIVIAIFILIVIVVYSIQVLSQRSYQKGGELAELTQNGRIILERITREIRQAREIVTDLFEEQVDSTGEIVFHDGHLPEVLEEDFAQAGTSQSITLALTASDIDDYYKDMFVKITGGVGTGQIRKITSYNGTSKKASIKDEWATIPNSSSEYVIDSSYYYVRYFKDDTDIKRQIFVYYFPEDPDTYVAWDDVDELDNLPGGPDDCVLENCPDCPATCLILEDRLIGEYMTEIDFWGLDFVNIFMTLEKHNKTINLETTISGRNI